jgi:hypothetical protein
MRSFRWLTCLFIAALFTDAANIPDIFIDQTVIVDHDDADMSVSPLPFTHHAQSVNDASIVKKSPRVIYDVDSPSLQAGEVFISFSIHAHSHECIITLLSPFVIEDLYLRNSSLLI